MLYKSVFFGYIAAAAAVVAALVLILIMLHQDRQYERRKLLALAGTAIASICMNTLYFLSYFDALTSLKVLYAPVERALDILMSLAINVFLFLFFYFMAKERANEPAPEDTRSLAEKLFLPALILLAASSVFAGIVYVTVVTEQYRVSAGHLHVAEFAQILLTTVICAVTAAYAILAAKNCGPRERTLRNLILAAGLINIITAMYNAAGSMAMFLNRFYYVEWNGVKDFNTWFFVISDILILLVVFWFFGRQAEMIGSTSDGAPAETLQQPVIPDALGLTPRESEIAELILQRRTYREIAEQLTISEHTVKRHVHNIYEKAGVSRRDELIRKLTEEVKK